jgi:hypothetical protein
MSQYAHPTVSSWPAEIIDTADVAHFRLGSRSDLRQSLLAVYVLMLGANAVRIVAVFARSGSPAWWALYEGLTRDITAWLGQVLLLLELGLPEA